MLTRRRFIDSVAVFRPLLLLAAAAFATTTAQAGGPGDRHDDGPAVVAPGEVRAVTGKSLAEWGARWWQWAYENPEVLGDTTGEFGPLGNVGGPVFFAEGASAEPTRVAYDVPGGQYILLPVATYLWTFFDPCAEVDCARDIINRNFIEGISHVAVTVDGEPVRNLRKHLVRVSESRPIVFKVDAGPIQEDGYGGILDAVQGGYWVMLKPLPPGKHRIAMVATVPNLDPFTGEVLDGAFDLDARLKLTVQAEDCD